MIQFIPTLFPFPKFIQEPGDLAGWLGWCLTLFLIFWLTNRWKDRVFERIPNRGRLFIFLLVSVPFTTLFFGIQAGKAISPFGDVGYFHQGILFLFSALPWVLAAGLIGILPAMVLAAFSGLAQSVFITHSLFTPLVMVLLALVYGYLLHQNFRTTIFGWLRHPFPAALFCVFLFFPFLILTAFISTAGSLAMRLNFSLTEAWQGYLMVGIELAAAGIAAEILFTRKRALWYEPPELVPSPKTSAMV